MGKIENPSKRVLLIDDRPGDLKWLEDILENRGYMTEVVTTEMSARATLEKLAQEAKSFRLAIIDLGLPFADLEEIERFPDHFTFPDGKTAGLRLIKYAREELGISPELLPIVCFTTSRAHDSVIEALGIEVFHKIPDFGEKNIRDFIEGLNT